MKRRLEQYRTIASAIFPLHQRGVDRLGVAAMIMLWGLILTGVWQFFFHESNPEWFGFVPDSGFSAGATPVTVAAEAHSLFGTGAGVVALVGTGWFAYRIAHRVPLVSIVALACILFGALTDGLIRYNIIKIQGVPFDQVGPGYLQVFTKPVEYVVTDVGETGVWRFRALFVGHVLTVPILVGFAWWSITRALDRQVVELDTGPKRSWHRTWAGPDEDDA